MKQAIEFNLSLVQLRQMCNELNELHEIFDYEPLKNLFKIPFVVSVLRFFQRKMYRIHELPVKNWSNA